MFSPFLSDFRAMRVCPTGTPTFLRKGLNKLILNSEKLNSDLEDNWAVVAEALQTILRREGYPHPYETLKELTRVNTKVTRESIAEFVKGLKIKESERMYTYRCIYDLYIENSQNATERS